jgi:uncharacterized membrane protein
MPRLRNKHNEADPLWHVHVVIGLLIVFQLTQPDYLSPLPRFLAPTAEALVMVGLQLATPKRAAYDSAIRRVVVVMLIVLIAIVNGAAFDLMRRALSAHGSPAPIHILLSALNVYITTIIVFALLYWEMDGGGPGVRRGNQHVEKDFLFPQQTEPDLRWHPTFIDYLYLAVTDMTAFSPTDTLPLSRRAKMVMAFQSFVSIAIVALVAARAINRL